MSCAGFITLLSHLFDSDIVFFFSSFSGQKPLRRGTGPAPLAEDVPSRATDDGTRVTRAETVV
jgi:hypothetical protein